MTPDTMTPDAMTLYDMTPDDSAVKRDRPDAKHGCHQFVVATRPLLWQRVRCYGACF